MRGLDVRYISLCQGPKNGRAIIAKADLPAGAEVVEKTVALRKADDAKRMVYGVVYAPESVDADGHVADAAEIESAMLRFMEKGRVGQIDTNHDERTGGAYVAESWLTKADDSGIVVDPLFPEEPAGTWAVGIKVRDAATWSAVEEGEITGLSLAGVASLTPDEAPRSERAEGSAARPPTQQEPAAPTGREGFFKSLVHTMRDLLSEAEPQAVHKCACGCTTRQGAEKARTKCPDGRKPICDELGCWCDGQNDRMAAHKAKDRLMASVDSYIPTPERQMEVSPAALARVLAQMLAGDASAAAPSPVGKSAAADGDVAAALRALSERIEQIEKSTPGRQTRLGGSDGAAPEPARGLSII
jgi:hypothetical protein